MRRRRQRVIKNILIRIDNFDFPARRFLVLFGSHPDLMEIELKNRIRAPTLIIAQIVFHVERFPGPFQIFQFAEHFVRMYEHHAHNRFLPIQDLLIPERCIIVKVAFVNVIHGFSSVFFGQNERLGQGCGLRM